MQYRAYILIFLLSSFFVSCEKDEWIDDTASASSRCTVFVRLGTDNNFRTEAGEKTALRGNVADAIGIYPSEKYNGFQAALDECVTYKACTNGYYSAGTARCRLSARSAACLFISRSRRIP
jgi:hypothetical protein